MRSDLKSKLLAVVVLGSLGGVIAGVRALAVPRAAAPAPAAAAHEAPPETSAEGRAVLNKLWFDRLPSSAKDDFDLWIFFSGGFGIELKGSGYRWTTDTFDLERTNKRLELVALHDKKTTRFSFEIKACDDKPPFDLCFVPSEPLRGNKVLYGFGDEEDAAHRFSWFRDARLHGRAAGEMAQSAR
jgi:hypothetical protein